MQVNFLHETLSAVYSQFDSVYNVNCFRTLVRILRTWLERFFEQDFYAPPKHHLLQRLCSLAEDLHEDTEEDGDAALCDDECDFLTFVKSKLQLAEVKSMQEQACQSELRHNDVFFVAF